MPSPNLAMSFELFGLRIKGLRGLEVKGLESIYRIHTGFGEVELLLGLGSRPGDQDLGFYGLRSRGLRWRVRERNRDSNMG